MLISGAVRALYFGLFLMLGGHPLFGGASADTSRWFYMIYAYALPLASGYYYFRWPWGPVFLCWLAMALNLWNKNAFPLKLDYYYSQIGFLLAAHLGLISYVLLKQFGRWPSKTHKEVAVSREQIVGE
jgi:hypothetical protein